MWNADLEWIRSGWTVASRDAETGAAIARVVLRGIVIPPSAAGLSQGDPWLCDPGLPRVCSCRVKNLDPKLPDPALHGGAVTPSIGVMRITGSSVQPKALVLPPLVNADHRRRVVTAPWSQVSVC